MAFKVTGNNVSLIMLRVSASIVLQSHSFFGAAFSKSVPLAVLLKEGEKTGICSHKIWGNSGYYLTFKDYQYTVAHYMF